jgi:methanogenic corrinoid protein MtbC1
MYTIKQAAARTGLSVPTIRAWERRYGVVRPSRTKAGYRLFDDESIARLVAMRHLVNSGGWRPSQAAERVLAAGADLAALTRDDIQIGSGAASGADATLSAHPSDVAADAFLRAAHRLDVPAMEQVLDESFASQRFELAMGSVVFPALRAIGDAWFEGEIGAAVEHIASETVRRRLAHFFDAAGRAVRTPQVIVGLLPGGGHEIGAFAFAVAARRVGLDVLYLGANVPLESWLTTARETAASVAVLAVVTPSDVSAAAVVIEALGTMVRPPKCALGGPLARDVPEGLGAMLLPERLDDAVAAVVEIHAAEARAV